MSGKFYPKGIENYRPHWPSFYPNGSAKIIDQDSPNKNFTQEITMYPYTAKTTLHILKKNNNLSIKNNKVSNFFTVGKTTPGLLSSHLKESFSDFDLVNTRVHLNPIWIIIAFLLMIIIIY
jgi:hypothetical protein